MKKVQKVLYIMVFCLVLLVGTVFSGCGETTSGSQINDTPNTTSVTTTYTIQVVGGSGGGVYTQGQTVTIVSSDDAFLWWQVEGESVEFSTSKTYSFTASKDMKITSYGIDRDKGFAILETDLENDWSTHTNYSFTPLQLSTTNYTAYVAGTQASSVWYDNTSWKYTSGFNLVSPNGTTKYEIKDSSAYAYIFRIYKDINGNLKAKLATSYARGLNYSFQINLATGHSILFENVH